MAVTTTTKMFSRPALKPAQLDIACDGAAGAFTLRSKNANAQLVCFWCILYVPSGSTNTVDVQLPGGTGYYTIAKGTGLTIPMPTDSPVDISDIVVRNNLVGTLTVLYV